MMPAAARPPVAGDAGTAGAAHALSCGLPLFNSATGPWSTSVGPLRFSSIANDESARGRSDYRSGGDPTAACVWGAAWSLATYLLETEAGADLVRGRSVVELGSGTGMAGLAAAAVHARSVCLTDLPPNLPRLEAAVRDNAAAIPVGDSSRRGVSAVGRQCCTWPCGRRRRRRRRASE